MIHHYNYSTSLSHFLSYHQFDDQSNVDPEQTSNSIIEDDGRCKSNSSATNKSFTIAAILGLQNGHHPPTPLNSPSDQHPHSHHYLSNNSSSQVVNLSVNHSHHGGTAINTTPGAGNLCNRLPSLPDAVRHHQQHQVINVAMNVAAAAAAAAAAGSNPFAAAVGVGGGCANGGNRNPSARGLKHLSHQVIGIKKTCKSKRVRTIFTPEQLERLEAEFERQQYMVGPERLYLAHTLQLTEAQVKVWFQNRRIKWRKHHLEITHQRLAVLKQQQQMLIDDNNLDVQESNSSSNDT